MGLVHTFHPAHARFISSLTCSSKSYILATSSRERVGGEDVGHEGKQDRGPHVFGYQGKGKENLFQDQDEWSGASWLWMM